MGIDTIIYRSPSLIPRQVHFSFSLKYVVKVKQLKYK